MGKPIPKAGSRKNLLSKISALSAAKWSAFVFFSGWVSLKEKLLPIIAQGSNVRISLDASAVASAA